MSKSTGRVVVLLDGEEKVWKTSKRIYSKINMGKKYGKVRMIKLNNDYDIGKVYEDFGRDGVVKVLKSQYKLKEIELSGV